MRRRVGIGAIDHKKATESKFKEKGSELASEQLRTLSENMETFRGKLEEFATNYRHEIRKNAQFRRQFQEMCASVGVDPLASSKGFWAEKLGVGDFYYELGVQIIEICMASSHRNGGIISLEELRQRLVRSRNRARKDEITSDDILRAVAKLKSLGSGFAALSLGDGRYIIQSVPGELTMDHARILEAAQQNGGYVTVKFLMDNMKWDMARTERAIEHLMKEGIAWVDLATPDRTPTYWFPALFQQM